MVSGEYGVCDGTYVIKRIDAEDAGNFYWHLVLDREVTGLPASKPHMCWWTIHGIPNKADEEIGSCSGYIGEDGFCNVYYRGIVPYGNFNFYVLGAVANGGKVYIANGNREADCIAYENFSLLDSGYVKTDISLASSQSYIKALGSTFGLAVPPFCTETCSESLSPVGDYFIPPVSGKTVVLARGGASDSSSGAGMFYQTWRCEIGNEYPEQISLRARPRLKHPIYG